MNRIDENFEKEFWIDESNSSQFVNRKQIYKDTINSTLQWTDYQLRPNFLIAAVVVSSTFFSLFSVNKQQNVFFQKPKRLQKCLIKLIFG